MYFHYLLHGNTRGYKGLQGVQGVTEAYWRLQGVTAGYEGLLGFTGGYKGLKRVKEDWLFK